MTPPICCLKLLWIYPKAELGSAMAPFTIPLHSPPCKGMTGTCILEKRMSRLKSRCWVGVENSPSCPLFQRRVVMNRHLSPWLLTMKWG
jgi:hypothetical protein